MNKGRIVLGVAAAVIGSGLLWAAGSKEDSGIAGWESLNVSMEHAIGNADSAEASVKIEDAKQGEETVPTPAVHQDLEGAKQNSQGNQTEVVPDTQTVKQPVVTTDVVEASAPAAVQEGKVNVNIAGVTELMELPGIGKKKAQAIIDYRTLNGSYHSLSDLGKVKGIGTKMLEKLKALVIF